MRVLEVGRCPDLLNEPFGSDNGGEQLRNAREPCFVQCSGSCASVYLGVYAARCNMFSGCAAQFQKELGCIDTLAERHLLIGLVRHHGRSK